jgi:hypothetical protein
MKGNMYIHIVRAFIPDLQATKSPTHTFGTEFDLDQRSGTVLVTTCMQRLPLTFPLQKAGNKTERIVWHFVYKVMLENPTKNDPLVVRFGPYQYPIPIPYRRR